MPFFRTSVLENRDLGAGYHHLFLDGGALLGPWHPGQFAMLRAWSGWDPLLPRAFSLYGTEPADTVEILLKRVGPGTERLGSLRRGDEITVHGPLGRPFVPDPTAKSHLLVGGGIGIVPLLPVAKALSSRRTRLLYGGRSASDLVAAPHFRPFCEVSLASDDGSAGARGFVTDLLLESLRAEPSSAVYACGPEPMLRRVAQICREARVPGQLCLEAPMACGYGACLGCVVATKDGYRRVCRDGPIFRESEVYL
jgi:dihydroorotate dehydrogenase electron transfer subunit